MKSKILSIFIVAVVALFGCGRANAAEDDFDTLTKRVVQSNAGEQNFLGSMYSEGSGVPQDNAMAYAWFNVAAASGFEMAKEARDMVRRMATPSQIGKGQSLATVIFARISEREAGGGTLRLNRVFHGPLRAF